jgi:acetylglutamate kinase
MTRPDQEPTSLIGRVVLKVGGAVADEAAALARSLHEAGNAVCVVHGAGPQISAGMERRGLAVEFVEGRRVTTAPALEVVREAFAEVNAALCRAIGPDAVGLMGDEIGVEADPVPELGLVGTPRPCRPEAVERSLGEGRIPVVAPLARGPLNVNADETAVALAAGLDADRLLFVTDVPGLFVDGAVARTIDAGEAEHLLADGLQGGIVPKLRAAVQAARLGMRVEIGETEVVA